MQGFWFRADLLGLRVKALGLFGLVFGALACTLPPPVCGTAFTTP